MDNLSKYICKYCDKEYKNIQQLKKHISFNRCQKIHDKNDLAIEYINELNNSVNKDDNIKTYISSLEEKVAFLTNQLNLYQIKIDELEIYKTNFDDILNKIQLVNIEKNKLENEYNEYKEKYNTLNIAFLKVKNDYTIILNELNTFKKNEIEEISEENINKQTKLTFQPLTIDCLKNNLSDLTMNILSYTSEGLGYFLFTCLLNAEKTKIKYSFRNIRKHEGKYMDEKGNEIHDKKFNYITTVWFKILKDHINDTILGNLDNKDIYKIKKFYENLFINNNELIRQKVLKDLERRIVKFPDIIPLGN